VNMKRILIFRPDNIGDVILFSGAFRHIRALYPHAHITLAVQSHIINLVELCPYVDKIVSVDDLVLWKKLQKKGVRGSYRFGRVLRSLEKKWKTIFQPFDLVVYPVKSPEVSHLKILCELGARRMIGIVGCSANAPEGGYPNDIHPKNVYSDYLDVSNKDPWRHELFTTLEFLRFLGCDVESLDDIRPEIWVSVPEKNLLKTEIGSNGPIVGLFPGAAHYWRCWNTQHYATLAESIKNEVYTYIIFGSSKDVKLASKIEPLLNKTHIGDKVVNLAGRTTLRGLYRCVSECSLLISTESAGLHMGITAGIPTIGIVGGGHYGRFVPWGDNTKNIILTKKLDCFNCNWRCEKRRFECIQGVTPAEVASAVNRLLKTAP